MRSKLSLATSLGWCACALALLGGGGFPVRAGDMKLQALLLWGTDESRPRADKVCKPVEPDIRQKLKDLPLRWTNWFEVNRQDVALPQGITKQVTMSDKCQVQVRNIGGSDVGVSLIGKGKETLKRTQPLPKGEILFLGGNAPNSTSWLVGLRRIE